MTESGNERILLAHTRVIEAEQLPILNCDRKDAHAGQPPSAREAPSFPTPNGQNR
jgi:hypothetical protein